MKSKLYWRMVAAQVIYHAYPDSDLLPIARPMEGETIGDFALRAEAAADTLFLFLCREANDDIDPDEYRNRLKRARRDIEHVLKAFTEFPIAGLHRPPR